MKIIKQRTYWITCIIFISFIGSLRAQETVVTSDLEQWTSIGISKKLNKHWGLSLDQEFRFNHNSSALNIYLSDFGVDYKLNKHFSFGANYRFYQNKNNEGTFLTQHRWSTDLSYKNKVQRFTLEYRLRFQNKDEDFFTSVSGNNLYNLRNLFSVEYNINNFKFDPFFDFELYRSIENIHSTELSKLRCTLGVNYSLKKYGDIEFFYRFDDELNKLYNKNTYIIGVGYKFSF